MKIKKNQRYFNKTTNTKYTVLYTDGFHVALVPLGKELTICNSVEVNKMIILYGPYKLLKYYDTKLYRTLND